MEEQNSTLETHKTNLADQLEIPDLVKRLNELERKPNRTGKEQGLVNGLGAVTDMFDKAFNQGDGRPPLDTFSHAVADMALFTHNDLSNAAGLRELNNGRLEIYAKILERLKAMGVTFGDNQEHVDHLIATQKEKSNQE